MLTLIRFLIFVGPSGCQPYNCFLLFRCCLLLHLDTIADHHLNIRQRQDRTVSRSRVYNRFLLLLQWTPRLSSLKHPYFHDSSIKINIVGRAQFRMERIHMWTERQGVSPLSIFVGNMAFNHRERDDILSPLSGPTT